MSATLGSDDDLASRLCGTAGLAVSERVAIYSAIIAKGPASERYWPRVRAAMVDWPRFAAFMTRRPSAMTEWVSL